MGLSYVDYLEYIKENDIDMYLALTAAYVGKRSIYPFSEEALEDFGVSVEERNANQVVGKSMVALGLDPKRIENIRKNITKHGIIPL